jgi:hypothetical protein
MAFFYAGTSPVKIESHNSMNMASRLVESQVSNLLLKER